MNLGTEDETATERLCELRRSLSFAAYAELNIGSPKGISGDGTKATFSLLAVSGTNQQMQQVPLGNQSIVLSFLRTPNALEPAKQSLGRLVVASESILRTHPQGIVSLSGISAAAYLGKCMRRAGPVIDKIDLKGWKKSEPLTMAING